MVMISLR